MGSSRMLATPTMRAEFGAADGVGLGTHQGGDEALEHLAQQVRGRLRELLRQKTGRIDRRRCGHRGVLLQERHWTVISKDHAVTAFASGKHARGGPLHHANGHDPAASALRLKVRLEKAKGTGHDAGLRTRHGLDVALGPLLLIGIALLVLLAVRVFGGGVRGGYGPAGPQGPDGPPPAVASGARQILDERFARGELTADQYREHLKVLGEVEVGLDRTPGLEFPPLSRKTP